MLSIQRIRDVDYYENLTALDDYYGAATEPPGRWLGEGAASLGLAGNVGRDDLHNIFAGFSPVGEQLVQNAGKKLADDKKGHRPGWDLTFSASKSVSVLWATADESTRRKIEACHDQAVELTLRIAENECGWSRLGQGGRTIEKAKLTIAAYQHGTSRALDPNLHTHCLVANVGLCDDGKTRTLVSHSFYRWKMTLGQLYQNELARELQHELGLGIIATKNGCEVFGVPRKVAVHFSKRRTAIEAHLKAKGRFSAKAAEIAALDTRNRKEDRPRSELFETWQTVASELGFGPDAAKAICQEEPAQRLSHKEIERTVTEIIEELSRSQAHFTKREILRPLTNSAIGKGISSAELLAAVNRYLNVSSDIIHLQERNLERQYTTRQMLERETELLVTAQKLVIDHSFAIPEGIIAAVLESHPGVKARPEQARAVEHILSPGRTKLLTGGPGTGKTFVLDAARDAWERAGYRVLGTSLAGKAVQELATKGNMQADTIAKLLRDLDSTPIDTAAYHANETIKAALGKKNRPLERLFLNDSTILVIDEAGMLDTPYLLRLLKHAERTGAKVVFVGDPQQLPPIGAGSPFTALLGRHEFASLTKNERQTDDQDKAAIHALSTGKFDEVIGNYEQRGRLTVGYDRKDAIQKLTKDWAEKGGLDKPEEHRIFVCTNADRIAANDACQAMRLEQHRLHPESFLTVRRREEIEGRALTIIREDIHVGDPIMCLKRAKWLGVENGTTGLVTAIDREEKKLTIQVKDNRRSRELTIPFKLYPHITRSYAQTTHKGQGQTVENAYILLGGPMQTREMTYVQISRAKESTRLYADSIDAGPNREGLYRMLAHSAEKLLAHDLLQSLKSHASCPEPERTMAHRQDDGQSPPLHVFKDPPPPAYEPRPAEVEKDLLVLKTGFRRDFS